MMDSRSVEDELSLRSQLQEHTLAQRLQLARIATIILIVFVWLAQTGFITWHAVDKAAILVDIEKFIALIGVTGVVASILVMKLWPQNKED